MTRVNGKKTKIYKTWIDMKSRCLKENHKYFKDYGGRGIIICTEWVNSFETFFKDMGEKPDNMQLDRINNDGNYEPNNCRWVTSKENCNNRRKRSRKSEVNK